MRVISWRMLKSKREKVRLKVRNFEKALPLLLSGNPRRRRLHKGSGQHLLPTLLQVEDHPRQVPHQIFHWNGVILRPRLISLPQEFNLLLISFNLGNDLLEEPWETVIGAVEEGGEVREDHFAALDRRLKASIGCSSMVIASSSSTGN
ncbi:hypothetical protein TYRP_010475 [Tyrophagus putrescentiae]|nr:hypothetical protein TYRP_010475 [Tyrophagus putrescentiae]